jgi:hypothetical protein
MSPERKSIMLNRRRFCAALSAATLLLAALLSPTSVLPRARGEAAQKKDGPPCLADITRLLGPTEIGHRWVAAQGTWVYSWDSTVAWTCLNETSQRDQCQVCNYDQIEIMGVMTGQYFLYAHIPGPTLTGSCGGVYSSEFTTSFPTAGVLLPSRTYQIVQYYAAYSPQDGPDCIGQDYIYETASLFQTPANQ